MTATAPRRRALADAAATEALGAWLARHLQLPLTVYLQGPLGAGKTTFCRGLLQALGHSGVVRSPTYTLYERYVLGERVCLHCDFYRLGHAEEVEYLGLREQLDERTLLLVEWPEVARSALPPPDLEVRLEYAGAARAAEIQAHTAHGRAILSSDFERNG